MNKFFSAFLKWSCRMAGKPISFIIALLLVALWIIGGLVYGFTDTWLLIINTVATINASLMVFIIQNTQNRESKALHIKIDELPLSLKETERELIAIEEKEEEELDALRNQLNIRNKRNGV
jgi:low affinity Fe/Cu permease